MQNNNNDQVILVNERDEWVGSADKMKAHKEGLLHRAFSVFVMNSNNEILLHQRALDKYHSGGLWTNACCSHPRVGESTHAAAHRRLQEEMGFDCEVEQVFTYCYKSEVNNGLIEHEFDHVYFGYYDGDIKPNKAEVNEYKFLPISEVTCWMEKQPQNFTPWFKMLWPEFLEYFATRKKVA